MEAGVMQLIPSLAVIFTFLIFLELIGLTHVLKSGNEQRSKQLHELRKQLEDIHFQLRLRQ
jgi:hypothetical protein